MNGRYLPRILDFFPHTRRGHGTARPHAQVRHGVVIKRATACVDPTCTLNMPSSSNAHNDQYSNVADWKKDHGFHKDAPLDACHSRETGRL